ncbi:hypothetical protein GGS20DRAFT_295404 [Poronia punctata]|nr:hypothetical protein GGS20DRAFT_295404 [Poronia punctata]
MFTTFSGSSRRPRNVDLSGQRNLNPWGSSARDTILSGASKTVAQAQLERERRHREREQLAAAKQLQRVWRGHRDRKQLRCLWRHKFDLLYQHSILPEECRRRIQQAFPLLLAIFVANRSDDQQRLDMFISELSSLPASPASSFDFTVLNQFEWDRLARLFVAALEKRPGSSSRSLLVSTTAIVRERPASIRPQLKAYYSSLARLAREAPRTEPFEEQDRILCDAITAPLSLDPNDETLTLSVYQILAYSFLASPRLLLLERNPKLVAQVLDLTALSQSILHAFSNPVSPDVVKSDGSLWLLAYFVALNRFTPGSQGSQYLEALYLQMSSLAIDIRARSKARADEYDSGDEDTEAGNLAPLPDYVAEQLGLLVDEDGIADLISKFDSTASTASHMSDETSLLAGYTLVLLRSFPTHSDEIKMRFFQCDIQTADGPLPSIKYLWRAASKTHVFTTIVQQTNARETATSVAALLQQDPVHDLEWRTLLLFLELYNFLLRVTDDEDFLPRESHITLQQSQVTKRIRNSGLALNDLELLVSFLKTLAFTLYYNLPDMLLSVLDPMRSDTTSGISSSRLGSRQAQHTPTSFAGIIDMDLLGLRAVVSSVMRALYERDSRRPFLPKDFWLMTANFDMGVFISAVVMEEIRNIESDDEDTEEEEESGDRSSTSFHRFGRDWPPVDHRRKRALRAESLRSTTGPKLEVLRNMPFAIPFEVRVQIFRQFVHLDQTKRRGGHVDPDQWRIAMLSGEGFTQNSQRRHFLGRHAATVARGRVFEDAFNKFYSLGEGLKEPIHITFVDQFQQLEAGIDGGGVTKEFLLSATNDAFSPERSDNRVFFVSNNQNLLYPNPSIFDDLAAELRMRGVAEGTIEWKTAINDVLKRYEFLGRIVGKCMYEGILIDIAFAGFFLLKWASTGQSTGADYRANLNDLRDLDPELYKGLMDLKNYPGDVADLSVDFTIADSVRDETGGQRHIIRPLRKDGANIPVTNKDRPLYISYVANHRLVAQQYRQTKAFLSGLGTIINPSWLSMFNQSELQRLIGGDSSEIDVEDLRQNTAYSGLYVIGDDGQEHPTIVHFWEVMRSLKDSERRDVLKYVTSTPRAPLLGFSQLKPRFSIRDGGTDEERLPSTSTCVNLLKLPVYKTAETLRAKLLYAVQSGAGFDLS